MAIQNELVPALERFRRTLDDKAKQWDDIIKIGRTHLADATPIRLGQEISGYARQVELAVERARAAGLRVVDEDYREPRWQEAFISPRSAFGTIVQLAQTNMSVAERERHWSVADLPS